MQSFIYRGKKLPMSEIKNSISNLDKILTDDISKNIYLNCKNIITALSKLSTSINKGDLFTKKIYTDNSILEIGNFLNETNLNEKIKNELKVYPGELTNTNPNTNTFEGYLPMGIIGHFIYSENLFQPFTTCVDSILASNINIICVPKKVIGIYSKLLEELITQEPKLCNFIYLFPIDELDNKDLKVLLNNCNGIEVQGDDNGISTIKSLTPSFVKSTIFEDKINFSYITKKGESKALYSQLASDYFGNSVISNNIPKLIYYECDTKKELLTFSEKVMQAIKKLSNKGYKETKKNTFSSPLPLIDTTKKNKTLMEIPNTAFKIIVDTDSALNITNDINTIIIKSMKRKDIIKVFNPYSIYLGTVGLAANVQEIYDLTKSFSSSGIYKITNCGNIVSNASSNIKNYVKRFSLEQSILPKGIYSFEELKSNSLFDEKEIPYKDIEDTTANSYSLIASGLNPLEDSCMNIIPNDNIYENILANYEILNNINVRQMYIEENNNFYYVADKIFENNINVLIGSSSYILKLLNNNKDRFIGCNKINKIFYLEESFTPNELDYLQNEFKISVIKPAYYPAVKGGILAISCPCCDPSVFHVNSAYNNLEILNFNDNTPVSIGEEGRLVWKYKNYATNEVITYDSGELGAWVKLPCKCGRTTPRFKVLGKSGDLFKINDTFINFNKIRDIFSKNLSYNGLVQIYLENINDRTNMTILVEKYFNVNEGYRVLYEDYSEYRDIINNNLSSVMIINMDQSEFTYNKDKIINVIDDRMN